jgi:hypothetical protein
MALPIINSHLESYINLNGKTFVKDGQRRKINIGSNLIKYPYKAIAFRGDVENLDCQDEFRFSCLENFESFLVYENQLNKMLAKV